MIGSTRDKPFVVDGSMVDWIARVFEPSRTSLTTVSASVSFPPCSTIWMESLVSSLMVSSSLGVGEIVPSIVI